MDTRLLRRIAATLVRDLMKLERFDLTILLVSAAQITRLNQKFLDHAGPTDVITFDYGADPVPHPAGLACGGGAARPRVPQAEIFVCVEQAAVQARRFRVAWQSEVVRCLVHGLLHLRGFDDRSPGRRRLMKRAEDRYLRQLGRRFDLARLG